MAASSTTAFERPPFGAGVRFLAAPAERRRYRVCHHADLRADHPGHHGAAGIRALQKLCRAPPPSLDGRFSSPRPGTRSPEQFGALPFIYGTVVTSALALLMGIPLGVGAAIFLAELAPAKISNGLTFLIELLAAVPSVIFGLLGIFVLVPASDRLGAGDPGECWDGRLCSRDRSTASACCRPAWCCRS